ncbi:tyrosine--tRNA ligase [Rickettsiales endosymbiont of Peranema trichophorum]|uniref:tyrosine--tRNA ligase n=1 Tax=Rickettsiales endosymbiont of Peranema trichophorum TaxID=2486577 RepID=UPI001022F24E|nr:tyrosine--tRNA ligase [Rickettsiales endosymbiont of Peranema trichophorum]RZI47194.1 tyrosine--tRNA ligase [Rickettsiales endosymbiont of Peranema trichophorum]
MSNVTESDFLHHIQTRGYLYQCTDIENLTKLMQQEPISGYIGFDCTAPSLHVGSLIQIMLLRTLQQYGYKPIVLLGSATTRIGDPSGKDEARAILSEQEIAKNKASILEVFKAFIQFDCGDTAKAVMVDNSDWLEELRYIDYLKEYGKFFSINKMLSMDSVKLRLERQQQLSFLEFNYMVLQAYDFVELYRRYGCRLQLGGSDQWGNIVTGVDLGRRVGTPQLYGITSHLITTSSGAKMGKTANGAVWLNQNALSVYDYWQFWRNTDDADVVRFLKMFTELPISEIDKLAQLKDKEINEAKIILANEATRLCHGQEAMEAALKAAQGVFVDRLAVDGIPTYFITQEEIGEGMPIFKLLHKIGLTESGSMSKKLIQGKGVRVNDQLITDECLLICNNDFNVSGLKISVGKKKHCLVRHSARNS